MTTITLTEEQRQKIVKDAEETKMLLTDEEVEKIASKVNEKINLPFLSEDKEQIVFVKIVRLLDRSLYTLLPNEIYECIRMAQDGIDSEEAETIKTRITKAINNLVNLPFLTENQEEILFGIVIGIIINAMMKGNSL